MKTLFLFLLFFHFAASAQNKNSSEEMQIVDFDDTSYHHSVKKAVIYSAIIPGAGQVYNHLAMPKGQKKAFWKVPLIYAGLGVTTFFLISNQTKQKEFRDEYQLRLDTGSGSSKWSAYDDQGILTLYQSNLKWRDMSILALGLVYILQVADAGIEAHFVNFDVSEDLSLKIDPVMMDYRTAGIRLAFNFH